MTVEVEQLREHIETDLGDGALGRLLADAAAAIEEHTGGSGEQTIRLVGGDRFLFLPYAIESTDDLTLVEIYGEIEHAVADDDYAWWGGRQLERLVNGTRGASVWAPIVAATLTPVDHSARVERVTIDLVRLAIQHNALSTERAGDYASSSVDYQRERRKILSELVPRMVVA
jgi:hypothetical protein